MFVKKHVSNYDDSKSRKSKWAQTKRTNAKEDLKESRKGHICYSNGCVFVRACVLCCNSLKKIHNQYIYINLLIEIEKKRNSVCVYLSIIYQSIYNQWFWSFAMYIVPIIVLSSPFFVQFVGLALEFQLQHFFEKKHSWFVVYYVDA